MRMKILSRTILPNIVGTQHKSLNKLMSNIGHMKQLIILAFDFKGSNWKIRKRIYRTLRDLGAELIYTSHWILPYNKRNLADMKWVCGEIRKYEGKAEVIKGEKVG